MAEPSSKMRASQSALDEIPVTRLHKRIIWTVSVVFFFEFADLNTFAYAAPALVRTKGFTLGDIATVTSAGFLGMFAGAVIAGGLSDRFGRRRTLTWATAAFSVFSLLTALGSAVWVIAVLRFFTGAGLSAMTVAGISFLSEMTPASRRGRVQGTALAFGLAGIPVIAFIADGVITLGADGWRLIFIAGGLAILVVPVMARLPESPRWLAAAGRLEDARAVIRRLGGDSALADFADRAGNAGRRGYLQSARALLRRPLRRRTLVLLAAWVLGMLGFYGFASWVPTLLAEHGESLTKSLMFSAITTLGAVPGALLARAMSDRFSRKWLMAISSVAVAACGIAYGLSSGAAGIVVFGILVSLFSQSFVAFIYTYTPEVFPTALRGSGSGVVYGAGRLANVFGPMLIPPIFAAFGYVAVFVAVAACWIGAGLIVAILGPETTGRPLENEPAR